MTLYWGRSKQRASMDALVGQPVQGSGRKVPGYGGRARPMRTALARRTGRGPQAGRIPLPEATMPDWPCPEVSRRASAMPFVEALIGVSDLPSPLSSFHAKESPLPKGAHAYVAVNSRKRCRALGCTSNRGGIAGCRKHHRNNTSHGYPEGRRISIQELQLREEPRRGVP